MFKFKLLVLLSLLCICGCAKKTQIASPQPLCLSGVENASAMLAAEKALVAMDFRIEKLDPELGIIRTRPLEGSQFFELWRKDNADSYRTGLSNLHTLRRIAEITFEEKQGRLCLDCNVALSRLSMPERQLNSGSQIHSMFSRSSQTRQALDIEQQQQAQMQWIDLGTDAELEKVILEKIQKQIFREGR